MLASERRDGNQQQIEMLTGIMRQTSMITLMFNVVAFQRAKSCKKSSKIEYVIELYIKETSNIMNHLSNNRHQTASQFLSQQSDLLRTQNKVHWNQNTFGDVSALNPIYMREYWSQNRCHDHPKPRVEWRNDFVICNGPKHKPVVYNVLS